MIKEAILHIPDSSYAFALDEKTVILRLRTKKNDIDRCTLFYGNRVYPTSPVPVQQLPMRKVGADDLFDYYECRLVSGFSRIFYGFLLEDESSQLYYYGDEFHDSVLNDRTVFYQYAYVRREDIPDVPEWASSAVIYQIFPDSFASDRRSIRMESQTCKTAEGISCSCRCGGTLNGIEKNLDYLNELGINCIYLNPIFTANSYHKYDTADYMSIDPCFGTAQDLKALVAACHRRGIRVLLDGVFNHCGPDFFAFRDVLENGSRSAYTDWFYHLEFPLHCETPPNYAAFAYVPEMPKLNTGNPETAAYFCKVGKYWIEQADIDGWRLDVANEINHDFWRQFRAAIRSVKPDAFLIGEIWEDSPQWLQGDQLDSTMNYRFSNLCRDYFAKRSISAEEFGQHLTAMLLRYKEPMTYAQMNLLDSHDIPRFLSKCGEDARRLKLALFFMLTFVGVPSIFYGDEAGISGTAEAEYRQAMPWQNYPENGELYQYLKALITLRKRHPSLTSGTFQPVPVKAEGVFAFRREAAGERLLVVLNNSDQWRQISLVEECTSLQPLFGQDDKTAQPFTFAPMEGRIFKC